MYNMFLCLPPINCVYFAATIVTSLLTSSLCNFIEYLYLIGLHILTFYGCFAFGACRPQSESSTGFDLQYLFCPG